MKIKKNLYQLNLKNFMKIQELKIIKNNSLTFLELYIISLKKSNLSSLLILSEFNYCIQELGTKYIKKIQFYIIFFCFENLFALILVHFVHAHPFPLSTCFLLLMLIALLRIRVHFLLTSELIRRKIGVQSKFSFTYIHRSLKTINSLNY